MLGDRHGDAGNVNLLKGVAADEAGADVAGDGNHRDGIHISGSNTGYEVGRTRSARCQADAYLAGRTGVAVRCVCRALFVRGQNMSNAVAVFVKCVIDVQNRTAGITENGINSLLYKCVDQNLCAVLYHCESASFLSFQHSIHTYAAAG